MFNGGISIIIYDAFKLITLYQLDSTLIGTEK